MSENKASNSETILAELAVEINEHNVQKRASELKGLLHGIAMGDLLIRAKAVLPHGKFLKWVAAHTSVGARMAQMYIRIAENAHIRKMIAGEYESVSHLTIREALKIASREEVLERHAKKIDAAIDVAKNMSREGHARLRKIRAECADEFEAAEFAKGLALAIGCDLESANAYVGLLERDFDFDSWLNVTLTDLTARKKRGELAGALAGWPPNLDKRPEFDEDE